MLSRTALAVAVVWTLAALLTCPCGGAEPDRTPAPTTAPATQPADGSAAPDRTELDRRLVSVAGGQAVDKVIAVLDQGADPNAFGGAALCRAAQRGRVGVVKVLLERGANANAYDGCRTPLGYAAIRDYAEIARLLVDKGADVNRSPAEPPLHDAATGARPEILMLLLSRGADPNGADAAGRTALHVAAWYGSVWAEHLLIAAGADVNARDGDGRTPLFRAVLGAEKDAAVLLLAAGADPNARDHAGQSVLGCAKTREREPLIDLLTEHGAKE